MAKLRTYRPSSAGYAVGERRRQRAADFWRRWRAPRPSHHDTGQAVDVILHHDPPLLPPMAIATRPQDWAPAARRILWPELDTRR